MYCQVWLAEKYYFSPKEQSPFPKFIERGRLFWECFGRARKINLVDLKKVRHNFRKFFWKSPPLENPISAPGCNHCDSKWACCNHCDSKWVCCDFVRPKKFYATLRDPNKINCDFARPKQDILQLCANRTRYIATLRDPNKVYCNFAPTQFCLT